ncbi:MAG: hypothetical protein V7638_2757 [Acidobacteriota bacterium]|jgi:hypothetical protein
MNADTRFTLLPFPQEYDGGTAIRLRIVVLPRNQNPLKPAMNPPGPGVVPFAEAQWIFEAGIISGLANFPYDQLLHDTAPLPTNAPANATPLFEALAKNFQISDPDRDNQFIETPPKPTTTRALDASVKKYLPLSYRGAFNFTTPRTRNAVTDDSYRCAVRDAGLVAGFKRSGDVISWGKVFAYALKQPVLARELGMIYETTLEINATQFAKGGWLYVDLAAGSDYGERQQTNPHVVKRYAARIPPLKAGAARRLFAPMLFPVLFKETPADPDPTLPARYDELFVETADYDHGFARVVHAQQPHSRDLLAEEGDGAHPVKDVGIRLGWDDEQILIWYIRQLTDGPVAGERLDAPLGVFGYCIDVRQAAAVPNPWTSLNAVVSKQPLSVTADNQAIELGDFDDELPYQVYPSQLDGDSNKSYWLPMYFANWNDHSLVLADDEAALIYRNTEDVKPAPKLGVTGPAENRLRDIYDPVDLNVSLRYGERYEFRVRLRDLSGGGTPNGAPFITQTPSSIGKCHFKRYVAPNQPRVANLTPNTDAVSQIDELRIQRPLLGYPAVKYTGGYADPVQRLIDASHDPAFTDTGHAFGIPDPDVDRVELTVEVQTLRMDNLLSVSGKENYVHLYTTHCPFPAVNNDDDFDALLTVPIVYSDCKVLRTGDDKDLAADLGLPVNIENLNRLILPTARNVRLTIRAVCEDKVNNTDYYRILNNANHDQDVRYGPILQVITYSPSLNEEELFLDTPGIPRLQGIFLQPDQPQLFDGTTTGLLLGREVQKPPDMIERLAKHLDLESRGLTLTAPRGERVQFGCSNRIRHILSPENSSITFSSKGDLMNHWLCCFSVQLNRDWTWDGLQDRAFVISREKQFTHDEPLAETEETEVGDIEIRHTAPFEALQESKRNYTRLIFIDAVEPKNHRRRPAAPDKPRFPDTIEVTYTVETQLKPGHGGQRDDSKEQRCTLPITTPPAQMPKIVSAGIALSPYERNEKYSATQPRRRYLWIEFDEPIEDPNDHYFARVLAYAPDQLISDNRPELFIAPEEPPLPIDPEYIRFVRDGATNDLAGLNAMQPMKKAKDSDRHYLLPLPQKLHENADELFGFFTYEFRVGHYKDASTPDPNDMVWCTAQGRFGRRIRVTGIQHPAPQLTCMVARDDEKIYVTAPYAVAVANGKNVTADPPRSDLWCLLYAQVRQADNRDFRNILLDNKRLDWRLQIEHDRDVNLFARYTKKELQTLKHLSIINWNDELDYARMNHVLKLADTTRVNKDSTKHGAAAWSNREVVQLLEAYGLPEDAPLSVLVVEFLPTIKNFRDHIREPGQTEVLDMLAKVYRETISSRSDLIGIPLGLLEPRGEMPAPELESSPVAEALGQRRILRTSPLTEVPFVCCTNC